METQEKPTPHFIQYGSTKQFFLHTLEHLTKNNIITPYTRDKLTDMITSEAKKDFAKARKHVLDIMALHDAFDNAANNSEVGPVGAPSGNGNENGSGGGKQAKKRAK